MKYLFKRLCQVLEQVTICSLDDELEAVIKLDFKPHSQNIFSYYADLRKAVKRLHDVNERLPESARIVLPNAYLRSRLVRAARQVAVFKPVVDALLMKKPEEWGKITVEELYHQLEQVCANDIAAGHHTRQRGENPTTQMILLLPILQTYTRKRKMMKNAYVIIFLNMVCANARIVLSYMFLLTNL